MKIRCLYDKLVPIGELKPHPKNRNSHPKEQIARLAQILEYQGFRYPIKVSKASGFITSGHGRLMAAKELGLTEVPVNFQEYESEEQEYADIIADNSIASWSELDLKNINLDLPELGPDFNLDLLGIKDFVLEPADKGDGENLYTDKIESPIYEPKGERPKESELYDTTKADELMRRIDAVPLDSEVKKFLLYAASRHTVFDYGKIAEFYAHQPKEVQELMEESALVIIDFKKAIELGFVTLTKDLAEQYNDREE